VNVQASCNHRCRLTFLGVAGPGLMADREALFKELLGNLFESRPHLYCVIGDCAYTPSKHLDTIYTGVSAMSIRNDNFNFFVSQLGIRIEMVFGHLVKKWIFLRKPLNTKLCHLHKLIVAKVYLNLTMLILYFIQQM
jgi:DDE superfamily endonuclease